MAIYDGVVEALHSTRVWLENLKKDGLDPENYQNLTGTLDYLTSGITGRELMDITQMNSNDGEYRPVDIRYIPHKGTGNLVTSDASFTCTGPGQRRDQIDTQNVTLFASDKFQINEKYVRENRENGFGLAQRLQKEMSDAMRVARESMNAQALAVLAAAVGANPAQGAGAGAYTTVQLLQSSDGTINVDEFDTLKNDQEDNKSSGPLAVIGLGNYRKYWNRLMVGSANERLVDPTQIANEFGQVFFKDQDSSTQLSGANRVLAVYPGAAQLLTYNLLSHEDFAVDFGDLIKGTMPDPFYPIMWDYDLAYDRNCTTSNGTQGFWVGRVYCYFDVWTIPSDAFGEAYGALEDFNGIVGYNITSA